MAWIPTYPRFVALILQKFPSDWSLSFNVLMAELVQTCISQEQSLFGKISTAVLGNVIGYLACRAGPFNVILGIASKHATT